MQSFGLDAEKVGYFVLDNAYNNDTAVAALADEYGFETTHRRLRCCCHILNLGAQVVIGGKDRNNYKNAASNIDVS
jgi:hypothetical protein